MSYVALVTDRFDEVALFYGTLTRISGRRRVGPR